jgi:hypothetical protein
MERMSLLGISLNKSEQRMLFGGLALADGFSPSVKQCTWSCLPGASLCKTMNGLSVSGSNPNSVQANADFLCWSDDACNSVDCPGAD